MAEQPDYYKFNKLSLEDLEVLKKVISPKYREFEDVIAKFPDFKQLEEDLIVISGMMHEFRQKYGEAIATALFSKNFLTITESEKQAVEKIKGLIDRTNSLYDETFVVIEEARVAKKMNDAESAKDSRERAETVRSSLVEDKDEILKIKELLKTLQGKPELVAFFNTITNQISQHTDYLLSIITGKA